MVLIDSDILIEVTRARNVDILTGWEELSQTQEAILCSPVSIAELWQGAIPREYDTLTRLFAALACVPIDERVGRQAGEFLRKYRKSHGLELGDALIASSAYFAGAELWTLNRKHYPMNDLQFFRSKR